MSKPRPAVIDLSKHHWRNPPPVGAPSHEEKAKAVLYGISPDLTGRNKTNWRRTPLYWVWAHLHGQLPPLANLSLPQRSEEPTLCTLFDATACFQGIKRPHCDEDNGDSVLVYVLKPLVAVEYAVRMTCPIGSYRPPVRAIEAVYSKLGNEAFGDERVVSAYKAAYQLAANDNVSLPEEELLAA